MNEPAATPAPKPHHVCIGGVPLEPLAADVVPFVKFPAWLFAIAQMAGRN